MKRYVLMGILFTLFILNISCKKTNSLTSSSAGSIDNTIYYYTVCKDDTICKFSCTSKDITSLSSQTMKLACQDLKAGYDLAQLSSSNNNFPSEIVDVIDSIKDPNMLRIFKTDDPNFKKFDKLISTIGQCSTSSETRLNPTKEVCAKCNDCIPAVAGGLVGIWKTTQFDPSSDAIYHTIAKTSIGRLQWSKSMGKMNYQQAKKACEDYSFKNYSDWYLPDTKNLEQALEYMLGEVLNLSPQDLVWSSNEIVGTNEVETIPLVKDYDTPTSITKVNKEELHYTVCVRKYNYD